MAGDTCWTPCSFVLVETQKPPETEVLTIDLFEVSPE